MNEILPNFPPQGSPDKDPLHIPESERKANGRVALVGSTLFKHYGEISTDEDDNPQESNLTNPDTTRGDLVLQNVRRLLEWGYKVVIVDGGSKPQFLEALRAITNENEELVSHLEIKIQTGKTMSNAQRDGYEAASVFPGVDVLMTTQPEKPFGYADMQAFVAPILRGEADMVIPNRTSHLDDYPPEQQYFELKGNSDMNEALHYYGLLPNEVNLDIYNGTRVVKNDPEVLAALMTQFDESMLDFYRRLSDASRAYLDPDNWFASLYGPVAKLLAEGKRVVSIDTDYKHPAAQTAQETGNPLFDRKRWQQYMAIVPYFYDYLSYLMHPKKQ